MKIQGKGPSRFMGVESDFDTVDTLNSLLALTHIAAIRHRGFGQWVSESNSGFYFATVSQNLFLTSIRSRRFNIINKTAGHSRKLSHR